MRKLTAALLSSGLIAPALVLAPTVSLSHLVAGTGASPKPVDPVITTLELKPSAGASAKAATKRAQSSTGGATGLSVPGAATAAPAVLTDQLPTKDFETVAVTWDLPKTTAPSLKVSVRTRGDHGWGAWFGMEVDDVNATAADVEGSARGYRGGTEPYWAGDSDGVQVRIDLVGGVLPAGLKVELIDPGTSAYDALAGVQPSGSAVSAPKRPTILTRAQWGADESKVRDKPTVMPRIKAAVIHHTAGANGYSKSAVPRILRSTYAYHLSRGWDDIGYNFLVDRFGRIWEGRAGGVSKPIQGAHSGGFNYRTFGVSVMGNYDGGTKPTAAALDSVARLIAWKLDLHRVDPLGKTTLTSSGGGTSRYKSGTRVTLPTIIGHRNVGYTACPGKNIYVKMASIRAAVARYTQAQLVGVRQSSASVASGAGAPAVTFKPMATQSWRLGVTDACSLASVGSAQGSAQRGQSVKAAWNGTIAGKPAKAGRYRTKVTSSSTAGSARPFSSHFTVLPPANRPLPTGVSGPGGFGGFTAVDPVRLFNSRRASSQPLGAGGRLDLKVIDRAGVPATGVTAVVLDVTTLCGTATTALTVRPSGATLKGPGALVAVPSGVRTAEVAVRVGAGGYVSIRNAAGVANLRVDLVGYYRQSTGANLRSVPTTVAYDSREAGSRKPFTSGSARTVTIPSFSGVAPARVKAALVNLTAYSPSAAGQLGGYRSGASFTGVTSMAYAPGVTTTSQATVAVKDGRFVLRNTGGTAHVLAVVVGVFTTGAGARYDELTPRLVWGSASGATVGSTTRRVPLIGGTTGVPADAKAVTVRLTATGASRITWIKAWAGTASEAPKYPNLRLGKSMAATNAITVPLTSSGVMTMRAVRGSAWVNVQIIGYYR
jgi:hypothetical protein